MSEETIYEASPLKRKRRTKAEMLECAQFLIKYSEEQHPITVRGLYYQAEVHGISGITKDEKDYTKIQRQVLQLRRDHHLPYSHIADATRYMRKPTSHDNMKKALANTINTYRRALWQEQDWAVEVWIEKSALAGVIYEVTAEYDVPLMPTAGYTSETFAYEAVAAYVGSGKTLAILAMYDFDRSGRDATNSLKEKVMRFGAELGVQVDFEQIALNPQQIQFLDLPTREPKRTSAADKNWEYDFACELDAMTPNDLRELVRVHIEAFLPSGELDALREVESLERSQAVKFFNAFHGTQRQDDG